MGIYRPKNIPAPQLRLGTMVRVTKACPYFSDWKNEKLVIVGIQSVQDRVEYETADLDEQGFIQGGTTDGWKEGELAPA